MNNRYLGAAHCTFCDGLVVHGDIRRTHTGLPYGPCCAQFGYKDAWLDMAELKLVGASR